MRRVLAIAAASVAVLTGCSIGEGTGDVTSASLFALGCWGESTPTVQGAPYSMQPTFFAAVPYLNTVLIRVQRGSDLEEFSDGLLVLVDNTTEIRTAITANGGKATFDVAIPVGVHPPGSPTVPPAALIANPPIVHITLYLQRTCHNQNVVLYAVSGTATFTSLFDGNPDEASAAQKYTAATFDVKVGDLSDVPLGGYPTDIPADKQSTVTGDFQFYFERGQPGQPFP